MSSLLRAWKKQVRSSSLGRLLRLYWKVFFNEERRHFGHRCERLFLLKRLIKKRLPKRILPSKVWFYGVEKEGIFDPFHFEDEKYFETMIIWKEREMKKFIEDHPSLLAKGYRHKKIPGYKRPIRV